MAPTVDSDRATVRVFGRWNLESRSLVRPAADAVIVYASYAAALLLRFPGDMPPDPWRGFAYALPFITVGYLLANLVFGGYRVGWRYGGIGGSRNVAGLLVGVTLVTGVIFAVNSSLSPRDIPLSVNLLGGVLILLGMLAVRGWPQLVGDRARSLWGIRVPRSAAEVRDAVPTAAFGLAVLVLLGVDIFLVARYAGVTPIATDDGRVMMYTAQVVRDPGAWILVLPVLQYLTYGTLITLFGWNAPLLLVPLLFSLALAVLIGYIAYQITGGKLWASLAAVFAVSSLPVFFSRSRVLTFHAPALFFGYAGVFAAVSYMRKGGKWPLVVAGLALPAAFYSYNTGLLFVLIPPLFLLIDRSRATLTRLAWIYAIVLVVAAPWLVSHLAAFGLDDFYRQRESWFIDNGYLQLRNVEFWGLGTESRIAFMTRLPDMVEGAAGKLFIPLAFFSIVGLIWLPNWSWRAAALVSLSIPVAALLYVMPATFSRYTYTMIPALVLLSVYGAADILRRLSSDRQTSYRATAMGIVAIGIVAVVFFQGVQDNLSKIDAMQAPARTGKEGELAEIAELIDDSKGVMGSRVSPLIRYERDSELLTSDFTSQEDFVTYLSWPSDEVVAEMFERNNVGWLLVQHPAQRWEVDYNNWLMEVTGWPPQHLRMVYSPLVERVFKGNWYSLVRVVGNQDLAPQWSAASGAR